jgi:hypothetical protein
LTGKVFKSKRHDTAVSPQPTFTPAEGLPFDLMSPGGATAMFIVRLPNQPAPKFKKPATIVGPWTVRYDPEPSDVADIGAFDVEVEITLANGKKLTLPTEGYLSWVIGPDLDNA